MENDDVEAQVQYLRDIYDKLDSLVDSSNPLTPNEIFTLALINSLPDNSVHVVTPLLQRSSVDSAMVSWANHAELTRRKLTTLLSGADAVAAKANLSHRLYKSKNNQKGLSNSFSFNNKNANSSNPRGRNSKYWMYCKRLNHNIDSYWELEELVTKRD